MRAGFERAIGKAREASADCAVERATKGAASDRHLIQNDSGLARGLAASLTTGLMAVKQLGQWRPGLADELFRTWVELEQRGLKKTLEYRNVMLRAARQA